MEVILVSYEEYPPDPNTGGIGTYTRNLAHGLIDLGHKAHVVIGDMDADFSSDINKGVRLYKCSNDILSYTNFLSRLGLKGTSYRLQVAFRVANKVQEILKKTKVDVIEIPECGAQGFFVKKHFQSLVGVVKFHTPYYLLNLYNQDSSKQAGSFHGVVTYLEKTVVSKARACMSPSLYTAGEAGKLYDLKKPATIVPNGINIEEIDLIPPVDIPDKIGIRPKDRTILYVGSMQPLKVNSFLNVVPKVLSASKHVSFIFAGRDVSGFEARLSEVLSAKDLPLEKVSFIGKQPYQDIIGLLKSADVYVHPTVFDNFPYACLEAMACGKAIVSTKVGGIPEMIVDGESGILVDPDDAGKMAEAVLAFIDSGEMRSEFGNRARERVEDRYNHRIIAEKTLDFYKSCL